MSSNLAAVGITASHQALSELPLCNEEGYLVESAHWTPHVAAMLAQSEGLELTELHWSVIYFLREFYLQYQHTPPMRLLIKVMRQKCGEIVIDSTALQQLFPAGFFKQASRIAGLPKPTRCT